MSDRYSFTARDSFVIKGRGRVWAIDDPVPDDLWDPAALTGLDVEINGVVQRVRGVETFAIPRSPEDPYRRAFALLVDEDDAAGTPPAGGGDD